MPEKARTELEIIPVEHMDEVLKRAIYPDAVMAPLRPRKRPEDGAVEGLAAEGVEE